MFKLYCMLRNVPWLDLCNPRRAFVAYPIDGISFSYSIHSLRFIYLHFVYMDWVDETRLYLRSALYLQNSSKIWYKDFGYSYERTIMNSTEHCGTHQSYIFWKALCRKKWSKTNRTFWRLLWYSYELKTLVWLCSIIYFQHQLSRFIELELLTSVTKKNHHYLLENRYPKLDALNQSNHAHHPQF